jgi:hypothetical protein
VRLKPKTLQGIADEIAQFGIDPKVSKAIVKAVIAWYEDMRKIRMRVSMQGRKAGRPRKMTPAMAEQARKLRATGMSYDNIGLVLGVKGHTVWYELLPPERRAECMKRLRRGMDRWRRAREIPI